MPCNMSARGLEAILPPAQGQIRNNTASKAVSTRINRAQAMAVVRIGESVNEPGW